MKERIHLQVNDDDFELFIEPKKTLLEVLREDLGLTGAKEVCGMGACGACTVLIDDRPMLSCLTLAVSCQNKEITTIEGLSNDRSHPVQRAWLELDVPQCGYCQSGQIMSAAALVAAKPEPSDADIDAALSGNICRCGTYQRIRAAVHRAAELRASA